MGALAEGLTPSPEELPFPHRPFGTRIQIAQHDDGQWMWAVRVWCGNEGIGYHIGPKWEKFAGSRADALAFASEEIEHICRRNPCREAQEIRDWLADLKAPAQPDLFGIAA